MYKIFNRLPLLLALFAFVLVCSNVSAQAPVSTFSSPDRDQCPGSFFQLTATQAESASITYAWTITGPSGFSRNYTGRNIGDVLTTVGNYNVVLTVSNSANSTQSTTTQNNYITVFAVPTVSYSAVLSPSNGCVPNTVTFSGTCTAGSGTLTSSSITANTGDGNFYYPNPTVTQTFTHTYTSAGTFTPSVTVQNSNGCIKSADLNPITINPAPSLTNSPSVTAVCSGQNFTYTPTTSPAGTTYTWTRPAVSGLSNSAVTTPQSSAINETLSLSGSSGVTVTYNILMTGTNGCTKTTPVTVFVRALPTVSISPATVSICSGRTATLTATPSVSGGTYTWSNAGTSAVVTTSTVGTYTVTYNDGNCSSTAASAIVASASAVTVSLARTETSGVANNDGIICAGASVTLAATPSVLGGTYAWSSGSQTTSSVSVSPSSTTIYTVTYTPNSSNIICPTATASTTITVNALPTNNFTSSNPTACSAPATTTYTASTGSAANSVQWTFNGTGVSPATAGPTSGTGSVSVTYSNPGTYSMTMTTTNVNNCVATTTFNNAITIQNTTPPTATFNPITSLVQCYTGNGFCFTYTGTGADTIRAKWGDNSVIDFWDQTATICHSYTTVGTFTVELTPYKTIGSTLGCAGPTYTVTVQVNGVVPSFTTSALVCTNQYVRSFTNTSVGASGSATYSWNISNTATSYNNTVASTNLSNFNFPTSPVTSTAYVVKLTITDPASGCPPSETSVNINCNPSGTATFQAYNNSSASRVVTTDICPGGTLTFYNETPSPANITTSGNSTNTLWDWNANDGLTFVANVAALRGSPKATQFLATSYPAGSYGISMVNVDNNGCRDTFTRANYIKVRGVLTSLNLADTVCVGVAFTGTDNSVAPNGHVVRRTWSWSDGSPNDVVTSTASVQNRTISHTFATAGTYSVKIVIEDDFGCRDSVIKTVRAIRPTASFTLNRNYICATQTVTVTNTSSGVAPLTYLWSSTSGTFTSGTNSASVNPVIQYNTTGSKTINITVTDSKGCTATASLPVTVQNPVPSATPANFNADCFNPPSIVNFTNTSTNNADLTSASWSVTPATGVSPASTTNPNPSISFSLPGTYTVSLTANSLSGCSVTQNVSTVVIGGPSGSVNVTSSTLSGCSPITVTMTVTTSNATSANLLFGDGQFQALVPNTTQTISHTYVNGGSSSQTYTPSVFVSNGTCNGLLTGATTITVDPVPSASISYTGSPFCTSVSGTVAVNITGVGSYTGGTYSASPAGLTINPTTGAITPSTSSAGTYTITYTVAPTSICPTVNATTSITIHQTPSITGGNTATICSTDAFTLTPTGTIPVGTTYTWSAPTYSPLLSISGGSAQATGQSSISQTLTNTTNASATATYSITARSNACTSVFTGTVTVNPRPSITNQTQTVCSGTAFSLTPSTTIVPADIRYSWSVPTTTLTGGSAQVTPIAAPISQTLTAGTTSGTAVYTITPISGTCTGNDFTATITVNPTPSVSNATTTICSGSTFTISPSGQPASTRYTWAIPTYSSGTPSPTISGGTAQGGAGATTVTQTLTNNTVTTQTATYTITATAGSCTSNFGIVATVNPQAVVSAQTATVCSGQALTFTPSNVPSGTTYTWSVTSTTTGVSGQSANASGAASVSQTLSTTSLTPSTAVYSVTPTSGSCVGSAFTLTVTINPVPVVTAQTATVCGGTAFTITTPLTAPTTTTYTWSAPTYSPLASLTGGSAVGTAQTTISQTLNNTTNDVATATYATVTPSNLGCAGTPFTATVTVNPRPSVTNQTATICSTNAFTITPSTTIVPTNTTYTWSAPTMTGVSGGTAQATGVNSISQTLSASSTGTAVYTVTPTSGTCAGTTFTATVTVNPIPTFTTSVLNPSTCGGTNGRITVSGLSPSTAYQYRYILLGVTTGPTNVTTGGTGSFLIPTLGAGAYTVSVINPVTGCESATQLVTLTNPNAPVISAITNQNLCGGCYTLPAITGTNLPGTEAYYTAANGGGTQLAVGSQVCSTQTVYMYASVGGTCNDQKSFVVTVNPVPVISNKNKTICSGGTASHNFANPDVIPTGTTYSWSVPVYSAGISGGTAETGRTNFSQPGILNSGVTAGTAVYTVTATAGTCSTTFTITVTVNPSAQISPQSSNICSSSAFSLTPTGTVPASTTYTWTAPTQTGVTGGSSNGTATSAPLAQTLTLTAPGLTSGTAVYTITPRTGSCNGTAFQYTVTVNPIPVVSNQTATICSGETFSVAPSSVPSGTAYSWTAPVMTGVSGGTAQNGMSAIGETLTSTTGGTAVYTVTPSTSSCTGNTFTVTVTVNQKPVIADQSSTICSATAFSITPSGAPTGTTYTWADPTSSVTPTVSGGSAQATGQNSISQSLTVNSGTTAGTMTYVVTPTLGTCVGTTFNAVVTVNPVPSITDQARTACSGTAFTTPISGVPSGTRYTWAMPTYSNPGAMSGASAQTSVSSISQTITSTSLVAETVTYVVTPAGPAPTSCPGTPFNVVVTINPRPTVSSPQNTAVCSGSAFDFGITGVPSDTRYIWSNPVQNPTSTISGASANATYNATFSQTLSLLPPALVSSTATYTVTPRSGTGSTCTGTSFQAIVTVNPIPNFTTSTTNPTICNASDGSITLQNLAPSTAYRYSYTGSFTAGPVNFTTDASGNATISSLAAGTYNITVTDPATNCTSSVQSATLTNPNGPVLNSFSNQALCGTCYTLPTISGTNLTGNQAYYSGPNGTGTVLTGNICSTQTVYVYVSTPGGCSDQQTFTVTVNAVPTVSAPASICQNLTGQLSPATGGTWSSNFSSIATVNANTGEILGIAPGNVTFTFTDATTLCQATTNQLTVVGFPQVAAGTDQTICSNSTATLAGTFSGGVTGITWSGDGTFNNANAVGAIYTPSATAINATFAILTITTTDATGVCPSVNDDVIITIDPAVVVNAGANQTVCATNQVVLSGSISGATSNGNWSSSTPTGSFSNPTSSLSNLYNFGINDLANGTVTLTLTSLDPAGPCPAVSSSVVITIDPEPTVNAGTDFVACGEGCFQLNGSIGGSSSSVTWSNGNGVFSDATSLISEYCPTAAEFALGSVNLILSTNPFGTCPSASNDVTVTFSQPAIADAGPDQAAICSAQSVTLNGTFGGSATSATWHIVGNTGGTFNPPNSLSTTYTPSAIDINNGFVELYVETNDPPNNPCGPARDTMRITINPTPTISNLNNNVKCVGDPTPLVLQGNVPADYTWFAVADNPNVSGETFASTVSSSITDVLSHSLLGDQTVQYSVTPFVLSTGCTGSTSIINVTVRPYPTMQGVASQTVCSNAQTVATDFISDIPTTTTFDWSYTGPNIGYPTTGTSGSGNIPVFTTGTFYAQDIATFTVTANNGGCIGNSQVFSYTINPIATVDPIANITVCAETTIPTITFGGNNPQTVYSWSNSNTAIGLGASGTGNILAFAPTNSATTYTTTITVTPILGNCSGVPTSFVITVNPRPVINQPVDQIVCRNTSTTAVQFGGTPATGVTYSWTGGVLADGFPTTSGGNNIPAFIAINNGLTIINDVITVDAISSNGCTAAPVTFNYTINPELRVTPQPDITVCGGTVIGPICFTGNVPSATYNYTVDNISIGIPTPNPPFGGNGVTCIPAFNATPNLTDQICRVIVMPVLPGCTGIADTFYITVKKLPNIYVNPPSQSICAGQSTQPVVFSSNITTGVTYFWNQNNTSIWVSSTGNGTGNIPSFPARNDITTVQTSTFVVYAEVNGCRSGDSTFTITVNPIPTVDPISNQTHCVGVATTPVSINGNFGGLASYVWSFDNDVTTLTTPPSGTTNVIPSFTTDNQFPNTQCATVTINPFIGGCAGTPQTFGICVNPKPIVYPVPDQQLCALESTTPVTFVGYVPNTVYTWTNNNTSIGLGFSANDSIPSFVIQAPPGTVNVAEITVVPVFGTGISACYGDTMRFNYSSVSPKPIVFQKPNLVYCDGEVIPTQVFTGNTMNNAGNVCNWFIQNHANINATLSGTGDIPAWTASVGTSLVNQTGTVNAYSTYNGCTGDTMRYDITVKPRPTVNISPAIGQTYCSNQTTTPIIFTSPYSDPSFNWIIDNVPNIANPASGVPTTLTNGNIIPSFSTLNPTAIIQTGTVTVTPVREGCTGIPGITFINVNPNSTVDNDTTTIEICEGAPFGGISLQGSHPLNTFTWVNSDPGIAPIGASGFGNIPSFTPGHPGATPRIVTFTVSPWVPIGTTDSCLGTPKILRIKIKPKPNVFPVQDFTYCACTNATAIPFAGQYNSYSNQTAFNWSNTNPAIGLGSGGQGDIPAWSLPCGISTTSAVISVLPTLNGCNGDPISFNFTINTKPSVAFNVPNYDLCHGTVVGASSLIVAPANSNVNWTTTHPSNIVVGSGSGVNIPSWTATNTTSGVICGTITATPNLNGCIGDPQTVNVCIKPTPNVDPVPSVSYCAGSTTNPIVFSGAFGSYGNTTEYHWSNSDNSIGLGSSSIGNIPSFTIPFDIPTTVSTITVTPKLNGCEGTPITFTITVNEKPSLVYTSTVANVCHGQTVPTNPIVPTPSNATVQWFSTVSSVTNTIGLQNSNSILAWPAVNNSPDPICGTVKAVADLNGCKSDTAFWNVCVNPKPDVFQQADITLCGGDVLPTINFVGSYLNYGGAETFYWESMNTLIGLTNGYGSIPTYVVPSFIPTTTSLMKVVPELNGCEGDTMFFNITVKTKPQASLGWNIDTLCAGEPVPVNNLIVNPISSVVNWNASGVSAITSGIPASGQTTSGGPHFISGGTSVNGSQFPISGNITIQPELNGCFGDVQTVGITVKPTPNVFPVNDVTLCGCDFLNSIVFSGNYNNYDGLENFIYSSSDPTIGVSGGNDSIPGYNVPCFNPTATSNIVVTPELDGCFGTPINFNITVKTKPQVALQWNNGTFCSGDTILPNNLVVTPNTTSVTWTNVIPSNTGISGAGTINSGGPYIIPGGNAVNIGSTGINGTITVQSSLNGCIGDNQVVNMAVNPTPNVFPVANQTLCSGAMTAPVNFNGNYGSYGNNTVYEWFIDNVALGLPTNVTATTGVGNIPSFTILGGAIADTVRVTVTPKLGDCYGTPFTFYYAVGPNLDLAVPINDIDICGGTCWPTIYFQHPDTNVHFTWYGNNNAIGSPLGSFPANGLDSIPAFCTSALFPTTQTNMIVYEPSAYGCTGVEDTFFINVRPVPRVDPVTDVNLCDNTTLNTIAFTSSWVVPTTYVWQGTTTASGMPSSGIDTIFTQDVINPTTDQTAGICGAPIINTVTVTPVANGCVGDSIVFNITVHPDPVVQAANDTLLCQTQCFVPMVTGPSCAPNAGMVYTWTENGQPLPSSTYCPTQNTVLYVTGANSNGCMHTDSIEVTYIDMAPPQVFAGLDDTLCYGESVTLTGTSDAPFLTWTGGAPFGTTTLNPITFTPDATNTYILTAQAVNGCVERDTITVIVNPLPIVVANASDTVLCEGSSLTLFGSGALTYEWDNNVVDNVSFIPDTTLMYVVEGTDGNGCKNKDSIEVVVNPMPVVLFGADMTRGGCLPFAPEFVNLSTPGTAVWDFGNGATFTDSTNIDTVVNVYDGFGCYDVTLTVTSPEGCTASLTQDDYVCVNQILAAFDPDTYEQPISDAVFEFTNLSENATVFEWFFGDGNGSDMVHPTHTYDEWGTFTVTLVAKSDDGCTDTARRIIRVRDEPIIYVPNSFTDEENGLNDTFGPVLTAGYDRDGKYDFIIYNRWGHVVFETHEFGTNWDGTFEGVNAPIGTYTWVIRFKDSQSNKVYEYFGHVNLIR